MGRGPGYKDPDPAQSKHGGPAVSMMQVIRANFADMPNGVLSLILVGAGIFYISVGLFSRNTLFKAGAAAYALLP